MQLGLKALLEQVNESLSASLETYHTYLKDGKTYHHAIDLKKHNLQTRHLLSSHLSVLTPVLRDDALSLILHYDEWLCRWDELELHIRQQLSDSFFFENSHTFPREAAQRLQNEYEQLKAS